MGNIRERKKEKERWGREGKQKREIEKAKERVRRGIKGGKAKKR